MKNDGLSISEISRQIGIDRRTINKYLKDDFKFTIENTSRDVESHIWDLTPQNLESKNIFFKFNY